MVDLNDVMKLSHKLGSRVHPSGVVLYARQDSISPGFIVLQAGIHFTKSTAIAEEELYVSDGLLTHRLDYILQESIDEIAEEMVAWLAKNKPDAIGDHIIRLLKERK